MSLERPEEEQPVREEIEKAQQKIGGLEQNLRSVEHELEALAEQREHYRILDQVCVSLEKLGELGVSEMFWGERVDRAKAGEHVLQVRNRIDVFHKQLEQIEARRRSILEGIKEGEDVLEILEDDLLAIEEEEEQRRNEWIIEREVDSFPARVQFMPWAKGGEDDWRFRKTLSSSLLVALLLGLLIPLIKLPLPKPVQEAKQVPQRVVQLLKQRQRPPPPKPAVEKPQPEAKKTKPKPQPKLAKTSKPKQAPQNKRPPAPKRAAASGPKTPQQRVASAGILAFSKNFSHMKPSGLSAKLGAKARIKNSGKAAVGTPERSMVTKEGPGSSGGINLGSLSRDISGGGGAGSQIGGVQVSRVASSIGGNGTSNRPLSNGVAGARTDEEIQIVFDRHKAALYRLYNRQLRKDPSLRGQMVLRLTIQPSGKVSFCKLQSTDMDAPELAREVVASVKQFDFGAKKDIPAITIVYPIDFLPAA